MRSVSLPSRLDRGLLCLCLGVACRDPDPPAVRVCAPAAAVTADGFASDGPCGELAVLDWRVLGEGEVTVTPTPDGDGLAPVVTAGADGAVVTAVVAAGRWSGPTDVIWRQGYQSWSPSGVFPSAAIVRGADDLAEVGGDTDGFAVVRETPSTSWWAGMLGGEEGAVLVGALDLGPTKFWTALGDDGAVELVWGGRGERIVLAPGESLALAPAAAWTGPDGAALWDAWAEEVAARRAPRKPAAPTVGWGTWNQYYTDLTEADVLANADAAAGTPMTVVLVDDGWEVAWGTWTADEGFPSGIGGLAEALVARGLTPGLWMAPFLVDADAAVHAEHPDWWVRAAGGAEVRDQGRAVLDVTAPGAEDWLRAQIAGRVDEGWAVLKLDFLYAAAIEGERSTPLTGAEAWTRGMTAVREAAGDAWIIACGAPLLPSVGLVESFRTGPDIAFETDPDPRREYLRSQVRSTAGRTFTDRWWWMDPDVVLARAPYGVDEARGAVVAQAITGGTWMLGDALPSMDPALLDLLLDPDARTLMGAPARPEHPLAAVSGFDASPVVELAQGDDVVPARWVFPDGTVALLNLGETPLTVDGPGGTELLTGATAAPGAVTLPAGAGVLWRP